MHGRLLARARQGEWRSLSELVETNAGRGGETMKVEILGCDGGPGVVAKLSSYLVDDRILIDAGHVVSALPRERLNRIECVVITHCHFDHLLELPFLPMMRDVTHHGPLTLAGAEPVLDRIQRYIFNPEIWFDMSDTGGPLAGTMADHVLQSGMRFDKGGLRCELVPMAHEGDTHGVILTGADGGFAFTSDTGPSEAMWKRLDDCPNVWDVLIDCSYPDEMEEMALLTKHLTPKLVRAEIAKLAEPDRYRVHAVHIKPEWRARTIKQILDLADPSIAPVDNGDVILSSI
jgi:ribonuclease BN (tRNA processing enzyme)